MLHGPDPLLHASGPSDRGFSVRTALGNNCLVPRVAEANANVKTNANVRANLNVHAYVHVHAIVNVNANIHITVNVNVNV